LKRKKKELKAKEDELKKKEKVFDDFVIFDRHAVHFVLLDYTFKSINWYTSESEIQSSSILRMILLQRNGLG